jgi:hypothetical protein
VYVIEGVFLGLYGNWFIDITKLITNPVWGVPLYALSILSIAPAYTYLIQRSKWSFIFFNLHVIPILVATYSAMNSGEISLLYWAQGFILNYAVYLFSRMYLDYNVDD